MRSGRPLTWIVLCAAIAAVPCAGASASDDAGALPRIPDLRRADGVPTQLSAAGRRAYDAWALAHSLPLAGPEPPATTSATRTTSSRTPVIESSPGVGANVRVNDPAGDAADETQSETSVAAFGRYMIAVFDDSRGLDLPPHTLIGYAYSTNGGVTWTDGGSFPLGGSGQLMGHAWVVADSAGNFVVSSLYAPGFPSTSTSAVAVCRGHFIADVPSFDPPVTVVSATADFFDQPRMAIDPANGNLYVTYVRFVLGRGTGQIECVRSTTGGLTWGTPVVIQSDGVDFVIEPFAAVGTNGEVYVAFTNHYGYSNLAAKVRYAISTDGGVSFGPRFDAADLNENWYCGPPGYNRTDGFHEYPTVAIDRSTGPARGNVYVVWNDATVPTVGTPGSTVSEAEPNDTFLQAQEFPVPRKILSSTTLGGDQDWFRFITSTAGQMVLVTITPSTARDMRLRVLSGTRADSVLAESYYPSAKYGPAFPALAWITLPTADTFYIEVHTDPVAGLSGTYTVDVRSVTRSLLTASLDHRDVVMIRSANHGSTWSPPLRLNDDAALYDQTMPMASVDSLGALHAFWYDRREGTGVGVRAAVYGTRSTNGGSSVAPNISLTDVATAWQGPSRLVPNAGDYSSAVSSGATTHPLWADMRNGSPDVYTVGVGNGVTLTCASDSTVLNGTSVTLSWTVTNHSPFPDAAGFTVSDSLGWLTGSGSGSVSLSPGGSAVVTRTFAVPAAICNGALNRVTFVASATSSSTFTQTCRTSLTVPDVNCAPVVSAIPDQVVAENAPLVVTPVASDPDLDTMTWSGGGLPPGALVNTSSGQLTWTPTYSQAGVYTNVTLTANDGHGGVTSDSFTITVTNVNRLPVLSGQADTTIAEAALLSIAFSASDPDLDPLAWTLENAPGGMTLTPSGTTAALDWTPTYNQAGTYAGVRVIVNDGLGGRDTTLFTITVGDVPRDVVAAFDDPSGSLSAAVPFDTILVRVSRETAASMRAASVTIALSPTLALSSTPGSSILQGPYLASGGSSSFQVIDAGGGVYTIDQSILGLPCGSTDSTGVLAYIVVRSTVPHATGTVTVTATDLRDCDNQPIVSAPGAVATVTYSNTAPVVAGIVDQTVAENALLTVTPSASDADGDTLSWSGTNLPAGAGVAPSTGVLSWTPSFAQAGTYPAVRLRADDGFGGADSASFAILVTNTNRPPEIDSIADRTVQENALLTVTPAGSDPDGDAFTWSGANLPAGASVAPASGVLTWTPAFDQAGTYPNVTLTATDSLGAPASRSFTIVVTNTNRPPVVEPVLDQVVAEGVLLTVTPGAADPDSDVLTWSGANLPAGASVAPSSGALTWTPTYVQAGAYPGVRLIASDTGGAADTAAFAITVTNVNDPPVVDAIPPQNVDETMLLTVTPSATDPDLDTITWSGANLPAGAIVAPASGVLTWTPNYEQSGTYANVGIVAADGIAGADTASFTIVVHDVPRDVVEASSAGAFVSAASPCASVSVLVHRATGQSIRGTSVTIQLSPTIALCATPESSIVEGTYLPAGGASTSFQVVALGGGAYTVDQAILGLPCGATDTTGVLFTVDVHATSAHASGTITVTAVDERTCDNASVPVVPGAPGAVTYVNAAPVIASIPNQLVIAESTLVVTPSATDEDADTLSWSGLNLPGGAIVNPASGVLTWTPTGAQMGTYPNVRIVASDGFGGSDTVTVQITVTGATGVAEGGPGGGALRIDRVGPDPFSRTLSLTLAAPRSGPVRVELRDVAGRLVARDQVQADATGAVTIAWRPRAANGDDIGAGVFLFSADDGVTRVTRRVVHVR